MQKSTIETESGVTKNRLDLLKEAVQSAVPGICAERAKIWTDYYKSSAAKKKSNVVRMAEALRETLLKKSIKIYPDELIAGNFSSKRVGGNIFPELGGIPILEDLFKFNKRKTNPLQISQKEIWTLIKIVPYWAFRFLALKTYRSPIKKIRFLYQQLKLYFYFINELAGISHIAPDYQKLITIGTDGIISEAEEYQKKTEPGTSSFEFYKAVKIVAGALSDFAARYANLAAEMAEAEPDSQRQKELKLIEENCRTVPQKGAKTFYQAVQSLTFAQIALNQESLDNSVCPGRMDYYLFPYYKKDIDDGIITRDDAKEILGSFSVKMSEIIPVFSTRFTNIHGGMFNGQVVTVGGVDSDGNDSVNELSYIFLELMDELRMRQPNYHARIHPNSPDKYKQIIMSILSAGSNSPSLYNDDCIIKTMMKHGYSLEDARNYTGIGCVEPSSQGKSFASTDAALFNVPILLELALNRGKRFGKLLRTGKKTMSVSKMKSINELKTAFKKQLEFQMKKLITDLQAVETANKRLHPTPMTSMLLEGCLKSGKCSTAGGALYNFSGIQCVGPADTGDAFFAVNEAVFTQNKISLKKLVKILKKNIKDKTWIAYLKNLGHFGNDREDIDKWTLYVVDVFSDALKNYKNTRGGQYVPGLYSVTAHEYFGRITGALPHRRLLSIPSTVSIFQKLQMESISI
jgi:formate C-acetyltransferase